MTTNLQRSEIFKQLKSLFEFDEKGHLSPMTPGMAGPLAMPIGYLDMGKIQTGFPTYKELLVLTWSNKEEALIVQGNNKREATNQELLSALNFYKQDVIDFREEKIKEFSKNGKQLPRYFQARLGMIPYFPNHCLE